MAEAAEKKPTASPEPTPLDIAAQTPPLSLPESLIPNEIEVFSILPEGLSPKEKYEYLSEYGTQILCLLDMEKGCSYLSKNFESITGQSVDAMSGQHFFDAIHYDYRARLQELLSAGIAEGDSKPFRCKLQHADKRWYWYQFMIHNKQGGEYVCILENIHDSMLIQNTLQKAKLEAELALRSRSEFLANMSHELRTPLNAVIGFSQIIESGIFGKVENPQYVEYVKHIQESGYDLLAKIEDLLEIASIDAGRVSLTREEVHVSDIMRHVKDAQTHHANSAGVTLDVAPLPADILLHVDRLKLQHILGHLVSNAIKFSAPGATVSLKVTHHKGKLQLYVQDTGSGMDEQKLSAIVTALQKDNCWTTANDDRTIGLGLALTREFVALHGGEVNIASKRGAGTTITLSLPKDCIKSATLLKPDYLRQAAL